MDSNIFINLNHVTLQRFPSPNPEIRDFHRSLPHYAPTPLVSLPAVAKELGIGHVLLKDESTRLGLTAFKILGASWAIAKAVLKKLGHGFEYLRQEDGEISLKRLSSSAQEAGFVLYAATDGNHGRAVARMASYLSIEARIFVPSILDEEAISKIRGEGASVEVWSGDYDQTVLATKAAAEMHPGGRGVLISDTALVLGDETAQWIVDGYQTMFDEIEEQILEITGKSNVTHVLTPVGVGSLAQAVVTHFGRASRDKKTSVITVEPETAACLKTSLEAGKMVSIAAKYTICSGMCCGTISANGWPILKHGVEVASTVNDEQVDEAVHELARLGVAAGPCGAATLAGLRILSDKEITRVNAESVVVMLCTEGARGYIIHN